MAAMVFLFLFFFFFFFTTTTTSALPSPVFPDCGNSSTEFVRASCGATLYPKLCFNSLARYASAVQQNPVQLAGVAANVTLTRVRSLSAHVSALTRMPSGRPGQREAEALHDCVDSLGDAADQMRRATEEIGRLEAAVGPEVSRMVSNAQTWMSAALTNEDTCADGFEEVGTGPVKADVCRRVRRARQYTSNALALVNSLVASR